MDEMEQDEIDRRHGLHEEHAQGHESAKESSASEDREKGLPLVALLVAMLRAAPVEPVEVGANSLGRFAFHWSGEYSDGTMMAANTTHVEFHYMPVLPISSPGGSGGHRTVRIPFIVATGKNVVHDTRKRVVPLALRQQEHVLVASSRGTSRRGEAGRARRSVGWTGRSPVYRGRKKVEWFHAMRRVRRASLFVLCTGSQDINGDE